MNKQNNIENYYFLVSFSYHYQLAVFHWRLSDSKSPQVSRSLLSIVANLNKAKVFMVSLLPLISYSATLLSKHANYYWYHCHVPVFSAPWQDPSICLFFAFFHFHSVVCENSEIHQIIIISLKDDIYNK